MLETGFAIASGPMLCAIISPPAGRIAERVGNGPLLTLGGLCGVAGLLCHLSWTGIEPDFLKGVLLPGLLIAAACRTRVHYKLLEQP